MHVFFVEFHTVSDGHTQATGAVLFQIILPGQMQCPKKHTRLLVHAYCPGHVPLNKC